MGASGAKYGIADQPLLLDRRHPGDVLRRHLHDALLLRLQGALRAGVPAHALRREDARGQRLLLRVHDHFLLGHLDVRHGAADPGAGPLPQHPARRIHLPRLHHPVGADRARLHLPGRPHQRHLQRGPPVLPDRRRAASAGVDRPAQRGRMAGNQAHPARQHDPLLAGHGPRQHQRSGRGLVRFGHGPWLRPLLRLLVHRLPGRSSGPWPPTPRTPRARCR